MAVHSIRSVQKIPAKREDVWDFFSNHANLQEITPPKMDMRIISKHHADRLYAGQIIEYRLKPLLGIQIYWMAGITQMEKYSFFVDEQKKGPYSLWHHQHHFREIPGGTEMTDLVHYKNPLWLLGDLANVLFIRKQLQNLFQFRFRRVEEIFGKWS